jgi:membrane protease YdiL (CAAX protease family)
VSLRLRSERWGPRGVGRSPGRADPLLGAGVVGAYSAVIVIAELAGALGWVIGGAVVDAALVPILLGHFVWSERTPHRRLLPVLALIALLRVLSIAAVVPRLPVVTWYIMVGGALLIGEYLTVRLVDEPWARLNLAIRRPRLDVGIAAFGIPAGLIGYLLLRPGPLMPDAGPAQTLAGIVGLVIFGAFAEELLFRGLLLVVAIESLEVPRNGLAYAALMSAAMYLGSGSVPYTVAVGGFGLILGATILRGGSLWGATASHGLALVGMAFVWPVLLGST